MSKTVRFVVLLVTLTQLSIGSAEPQVSGGQTCAAITPAQARFLEWRETFLINRDPNRSLFVACPLFRDQGAVQFSATVNLISEASAVQDILCVFREVDSSGQVVNDFAATVQVTSGNAAAASLPFTAVTAADGFFSVTCRLRPDTGISTILQDSR